jgi:hypothetical protein
MVSGLILSLDANNVKNLLIVCDPFKFYKIYKIIIIPELYVKDIKLVQKKNAEFNYKTNFLHLVIFNIQ